MRILYMGSLGEGQTSRQRLDVIRRIGHEVTAVENSSIDRNSFVGFWIYRVRLKLFRWGIDAMTVRDIGGCEDVLASISNNYYDILWMDKNWVIGKDSLSDFRRRNPSTIVVGYSPDDMAARYNQSRQFLETLPFYDVFFTTKSYGVAELEALECPRVLFVNNAYDEETHRPWDVTLADRMALGGQVGFIGMYEPARANSIRHLGQHGIPVRIWGPSWHRFLRVPKTVTLEFCPVWGAEYAKAISAFDINLAFLSKRNRDRQTTRTVEIPACGGFMLAERTDEHIALFKEGVEADYFSSNEELLDKVRYYLSHDDIRQRIARAGRERCLAGGYGNRRMIEKIFSIIEQRESQGEPIAKGCS
jgi:spore maturation protein CgeB